jgi:hypothetical protein
MGGLDADHHSSPAPVIKWRRISFLYRATSRNRQRIIDPVRYEQAGHKDFILMLGADAKGYDFANHWWWSRSTRTPAFALRRSAVSDSLPTSSRPKRSWTKSPTSAVLIRCNIGSTSWPRQLVRNILLALLSSLAKVEAQKISERTRAGMSRAKAKGIKIGRPKLATELRHEITRRAATGETAYAIAKAASHRSAYGRQIFAVALKA